jgi:hypothetical protein
MIWWIKRIQKNIKDLYDLEFNPDIFAFAMANPYWGIVDLKHLESLWFKKEDTKEVRFTYRNNNKIITYKIPFKKRFEYQKFLLSWEEEDLPKDTQWLKF